MPTRINHLRAKTRRLKLENERLEVSLLSAIINDSSISSSSLYFFEMLWKILGHGGYDDCKIIRKSLSSAAIRSRIGTRPVHPSLVRKPMPTPRSHHLSASSFAPILNTNDDVSALLSDSKNAGTLLTAPVNLGLSAASALEKRFGLHLQRTGSASGHPVSHTFRSIALNHLASKILDNVLMISPSTKEIHAFPGAHFAFYANDPQDQSRTVCSQCQSVSCHILTSAMDESRVSYFDNLDSFTVPKTIRNVIAFYVEGNCRLVPFLAKNSQVIRCYSTYSFTPLALIDEFSYKYTEETHSVKSGFYWNENQSHSVYKHDLANCVDWYQPNVSGTSAFNREVVMSFESHQMCEIRPVLFSACVSSLQLMRDYYVFPDLLANSVSPAYITVKRHDWDKFWPKAFKGEIDLEVMKQKLSVSTLSISVDGVAITWKMNLSADAFSSLALFAYVARTTVDERMVKKTDVKPNSAGIMNRVVNTALSKAGFESSTLLPPRIINRLMRYIYGDDETIRFADISARCLDEIYGSRTPSLSLFTNFVDYMNTKGFKRTHRDVYLHRISFESIKDFVVNLCSFTVDRILTLATSLIKAVKIASSEVFLFVSWLNDQAIAGNLVAQAAVAVLFALDTPKFFAALTSTFVKGSANAVLGSFGSTFRFTLPAVPRFTRVPTPDEIGQFLFNLAQKTITTESWLIGCIYTARRSPLSEVGQIILKTFVKLFAANFEDYREQFKQAMVILKEDTAISEAYESVTGEKLPESLATIGDEVQTINPTSVHGTPISISGHSRVKNIFKDGAIDYTDVDEVIQATSGFTFDQGNVVERARPGFVHSMQAHMAKPWARRNTVMNNLNHWALALNNLWQAIDNFGIRMSPTHRQALEEIDQDNMEHFGIDMTIAGLPMSAKSAMMRQTCTNEDVIVVPSKKLADEWIQETNKLPLDQRPTVVTQHNVFRKGIRNNAKTNVATQARPFALFRRAYVDECFTYSHVHVMAISTLALETVALGDPSQIGAIFAEMAGDVQFNPEFTWSRCLMIFPVSFLHLDALSLFAQTVGNFLGYTGNFYSACDSSEEEDYFYVQSISDMPHDHELALCAMQRTKHNNSRTNTNLSTIHEAQGARCDSTHIILTYDETVFLQAHLAHFRVAITRGRKRCIFFVQQKASINQFAGMSVGLNGTRVDFSLAQFVPTISTDMEHNSDLYNEYLFEEVSYVDEGDELCWDKEEMVIGSVDFKPICAKLNFDAVSEEVLSGEKVAGPLEAFVQHQIRFKSFEDTNVKLDATDRQKIRNLFKKDLVPIVAVGKSKDVNQIRNIVKALAGNSQIYDDAFIKAGPAKNQWKPMQKRQEVIAMQPEYQAFFDSLQRVLQAWTKVNVREGIHVDLYDDETVLQANLERMGKMSDRLYYYDIVSQDSSHRKIHVEGLTYICGLAGLDKELAVFLEWCRANGLAKDMNGFYSLPYSYSLASGAPWTLIANILHNLTTLAIDSDLDGIKFVAVKGDNVLLSRKIRWNMRRKTDAKYELELVDRLVFCSRLFAGIVVRRLSRKFIMRDSIKGQGLDRARDRFKDLLSLRQEIMSVGKENYACLLEYGGIEITGFSGYEFTCGFLHYVNQYERILNEATDKPKLLRKVCNASERCVIKALDHLEAPLTVEDRILLDRDDVSFRVLRKIMKDMTKDGWNVQIQEGLGKYVLRDLEYRASQATHDTIFIYDDHVASVKFRWFEGFV